MVSNSFAIDVGDPIARWCDRNQRKPEFGTHPANPDVVLADPLRAEFHHRGIGSNAQGPATDPIAGLDHLHCVPGALDTVSGRQPAQPRTYDHHIEVEPRTALAPRIV